MVLAGASAVVGDSIHVMVEVGEMPENSALFAGELDASTWLGNWWTAFLWSHQPSTAS